MSAVSRLHPQNDSVFISLTPLKFTALCVMVLVFGVLSHITYRRFFHFPTHRNTTDKANSSDTIEEEHLKEVLSLVTHSANISVWSKDIVTEEFSADAFFWKLYGLEPIDNLDLRDTAHPDDLPNALTLLEKVLKDTSGQKKYEIRHRTTNPHVESQYVQSYFNVLRDQYGLATKIIGISWDVTNEVEREKHLQAIAARFEIAVESANLQAWEYDYALGRYTWLHNRIKKFGLDDVPLDKFHDAIYKIALPEDRHIFFDSPTEAFRAGKHTYTVHQRFKAIDGSILHFKAYVRILSGSSTKDFRVLGVGWDETEKVQRELDLEEKIAKEQALSQRLDVATRSSNYSPWEFDLSTKSYSWIGARVSKKLEGLSDKEYSTFLINSVEPEVRNKIIQLRRDAIQSGKDYYDFQYQLKDIDGSILYAKNYVRIIRDSDGKALKLIGAISNITEYIETHQKLEKQTQTAETLKERLTQSIQSAGIVAFELDVKRGVFTWFENSLPHLQGSSGEDQLLSKYLERVHPDDRVLLSEHIDNAIKESRNSISYRYRIYDNEGQLRHMQIFGRIYLDENGRTNRIIGAGWDVTGEVHSANELQQQTELLDQIKRRLERASLSSSEGHWENNFRANQQWCSSSFYTLLGYEKDSINFENDIFEKLIYSEDINKYRAALHTHIAANTPFDIQVRLTQADNSLHWYRLRGMAERDETGTATSIAGSIQDVEEQKRAEDALYNAQQRFERAINGTQDGLYEMDFANNELWCSPRLAAMLGYPAKRIENRAYAATLIHPEDIPIVKRMTLDHFRHNKAFDIEIRVKHSNGNYIWYHIRANSERDHNNRVTRLSGSFQDVTAAHAAQEELIKVTLAANAAEAASKTTSAFLANVSHEIRTPMNGITGMSSLLKNTDLNPTQLEYVNTIGSSAESLLDIINDILDFSKLSSDHVHIESAPFNLRNTFEDLGTVLPLNAANQGLELIVNVSPELPSQVEGNGEKIKQCLLNLVANAIKFTKQGEVIVNIYPKDKTIDSDIIHFEVCDTGIGIKPDTLNMLCQPFVQEDWSDTRGFGGTGLGLSIVQRLLELMDSRLKVSSELGKGSVFSFDLRLPACEPVKKSNHQHHGSILIVDDNSTFRQITSYQLAQYGYSIETANSAADSLLKLQYSARNQQAFNFALIELYGADENGQELCRTINSSISENPPQMILVTPPDGKLTEEELVSCGAVAQITKPIKTAEILPLIQARKMSGNTEKHDIFSQPESANTPSKTLVKALLVEDNAVNQKVASRLLEKMGCEVTVAANGEIALSLYQHNPFDIVFMDIQMPVMDGINATRKIREYEQSSKTFTPIVALTANALDSDKERCKAATMDGFITKPIDPEELYQALANLTHVKSPSTK